MELLFALALRLVNGPSKRESISLQSFSHRRSGLHMPVSSIDLLPFHRNPTLPRYTSTTATSAAPSICHTFTHTVFTILWYRKVFAKCIWDLFISVIINFVCNWYLSFAIYYQFKSVWHAFWHYIFLFPKNEGRGHFIMQNTKASIHMKKMPEKQSEYIVDLQGLFVCTGLKRIGALSHSMWCRCANNSNKFIFQMVPDTIWFKIMLHPGE